MSSLAKSLLPLAVGSAAAVAHAQPTADLLAGGFSQPLFLTTTPDDASTLYVVEKTGRVKTVDAATGSVTGTFLDLSSQVSTNSERGLLGIAFAPDHAASGEFYANYTNFSGTSTIARFRRSASDTSVADPAGRTILQIGQPFVNHNGGWIGFSPNEPDNLWYSVGDGGSFNDPQDNAQNPFSRLGKLLRLDVSGSDFSRSFTIPADNPFIGNDPGNIDDLVVADGLRNAFRASFDRATGDLYLADVGQDFREEVSLLPAGELGFNFGWRDREGYLATPTGGIGGPKPPRHADPIFDYAHDATSAAAGTPGTGLRPVLGQSITGGYVYRGEDLGPDFQGKYFFADFVTDRIFTLDVDAAQGLDELADFNDLENLDLPFQEVTDTFFPGGNPGGWSSFGEDADGELYLISIGGNVYRLDFDTTPGDADFDLDVDLADFGILRANFGRTDGPRFQDGDFNDDDVVDLADFGLLRANFGGDAADAAVLDAWHASVVPEPTVALVAVPAWLLARRRR